MKKLLPLVLLLIGVGAGVGAGVFLRPEAVTKTDGPSMETAEKTHAEKNDDHGEKLEKEQSKGHEKDHDDGHEDTGGSEYVKLNNQFVVPIVVGDRVTALVVLALSVEVPAGETDIVYQREPKLRDSFLQVLFDHANIGGFEGNFTDAQVLGRLRSALKEVAQRDLGEKIAEDVLIIEIARQDY